LDGYNFLGRFDCPGAASTYPKRSDEDNNHFANWLSIALVNQANLLLLKGDRAEDHNRFSQFFALFAEAHK
jgi:hypothetical protein